MNPIHNTALLRRRSRLTNRDGGPSTRDGARTSRDGWRPTRLVVAVIVAACSVGITVLEVGMAPAAAAAVQAPHCPPDCGSVAAGDPLLVPYVTVNPGLGWLAVPSADVQPYANALKHNVSTGKDSATPVNVVAARWEWVTGHYNLLIVLVSSPSLGKLHLESPAGNASDLCGAARGEPRSQLGAIAGIPGSEAGLCALPSPSLPSPSSASPSPAQVATVVAFNRSNVATLIEITSKSMTPIDGREATSVAQQQYQALPPGGVLVSTGLDLDLIVFWLCMLGAVVIGTVACARRRQKWRGPLDAMVEAFSRRRIALGVSLLAVVGAMAFSMLDSSVLHGSGQWYEASFNDFWRNWADGAYMTFGGGYGHIYTLDRTLETAPALQVVIAPIARMGFGLSFPNPSSVLYPQAFWVAGPLFLGAMALPICAGDRWLQYMSASDTGRRLTVLAVMAVTLPPIALYGHPEDLVALGCMLYGLIAALEGRHRATGWWLGVALAFQLFSILAIPIAFVFLKRRQWVPAIIPMIAVPLSVVLIPLITQPSAMVQQLLHQKVFDDLGYISPTWHLDPGVGAFIRVLVALLSIPAALVLAKIVPTDRRAAANLVVWVIAVLFACRVFEPELVPYFLAPTLALLPISAVRAPWWRFGGACVLAVWLNWWVHVAVQARWSLWLILIAQLAVLGWLSFPRLAGGWDDGREADTHRPARSPANARGRPKSVARVG